MKRSKELEDRKELNNILVEFRNQEFISVEECINCLEKAIAAIEKWAKERYADKKDAS